MPELPEVETIRRDLETSLPGRQVAKIEIFQPRVIGRPDAPAFSEISRGKTWGEVRRRGKYLLMALDGWQLVVSLRMTGQLVLAAAGEAWPPHTHVVWHLENGEILRFTDQRRFGRLYLVPAEQAAVQTPVGRLGPEPLEEEFTLELLADLCRRSRPGRRLKSWLLDQEVIAGLGNIYSDEVLFAAGLHPDSRIGDLDAEALARLYRSIRQVLPEAISHRGTSIRNYVDASGAPGQHQNYLRVYGREGGACPRCGAAIRRLKIAGRSTYFCPACQGRGMPD